MFKNERRQFNGLLISDILRKPFISMQELKSDKHFHCYNPFLSQWIRPTTRMWWENLLLPWGGRESILGKNGSNRMELLAMPRSQLLECYEESLEIVSSPEEQTTLGLLAPLTSTHVTSFYGGTWRIRSSQTHLKQSPNWKIKFDKNYHRWRLKCVNAHSKTL